MENKYDIIVVGAGHAGCEAALASARMGANTLLLTMSISTIAQMSCNPAIGGPAKGHLVREIDALGGEMGLAIDETGIQFRILNKSKGPAVWASRAQADRQEYSEYMRIVLEKQSGLSIFQAMAVSVLTDQDIISGVKTDIGQVFLSQVVILTCGTFLNGLIHIGLKSFSAGRAGEFPVKGITESLLELGFESGRLKTGTPPRLDRRSIDFSKLDAQHGDEKPQPFSFRTKTIQRQQLPVFLTYTNSHTHDILRTGLDRSPLYSGKIVGIGPRYCPSIEDKIVRFKEKDRHQIFLEPEGRHTGEYYVNGFATSLPEDIQVAAMRSIEGLENAKITRLGYAIEYDYFPPTQLRATLETKKIRGLFFAGQINGTSGYEEAAAQGFIAGVNAVLYIKKKKPFILDRSDAYIGVLIDDLVTKGTNEPYRLFTSRAEYRLLLRQDNADRRLMHFGFHFGLIEPSQMEKLEKKKFWILDTINLAHQIKPDADKINMILEKNESNTIAYKQNLHQLLKRPELNFEKLSDLPEIKQFTDRMGDIADEVMEQVEIEIKYEGYLTRQKEAIDRFHQMEGRRIPVQIDYSKLNSISIESREKLNRIRPVSLGQASRISGVSPSDIAVLTIYLAKDALMKDVPRGTD